MNNIIKPRKLKSGDTLGICAPSSPHRSRENFYRAAATLVNMGIKVKPGPNLWEKNGYLAGTDKERAQDLNDFFSDPEISGIMAIKGGYGSARILEFLDWDAIRKNPKVFIGFSDITALHLALQKETGLVTFHGPVFFQMAPERQNPYIIEGWRKALMTSKPLGTIPPAPEEEPFTYTINPGRAEGPLVGGCLSLITQSLGTPHEIDTRGKILFLEEVGEEPYKIDGMLHHLYRAGKLQEAEGIVVGECHNCKPKEHSPSFNTGTFILEEVLADIIGSLNKPAFYGLPLGHGRNIATIPMGIRARIDASNCELTILESATQD